MKKLIIVVWAIIFGCQIGYSQKREHVMKDVHATKHEGSRGTAIKRDVPVTDSSFQQPDSSQQVQSCSKITLDNYTGYWIKVYVNGFFQCYIEPWKQGEIFMELNSTWYCETAGGTYSWSSTSSCCNDMWVNLRE